MGSELKGEVLMTTPVKATTERAGLTPTPPYARRKFPQAGDRYIAEGDELYDMVGTTLI